MEIYLASYRPLSFNKAGKTAISRFKLPLYIDSSIRREPDFESIYPGISSTCRASKLAPKLRVGDTVVYITKKGKYVKMKEKHWMLTSILKVKHRFENHQDAANWYLSQGLDVPSNCVIGCNCIPLEMTAMSLQDAVDAEAAYQKRTTEYPSYLVCEPIYKELNNPVLITEQMMIDIFGYVRCTQTPPTITEEQLKKILRLTGEIIDA